MQLHFHVVSKSILLLRPMQTHCSGVWRSTHTLLYSAETTLRENAETEGERIGCGGGGQFGTGQWFADTSLGRRARLHKSLADVSVQDKMYTRHSILFSFRLLQAAKNVSLATALL